MAIAVMDVLARRRQSPYRYYLYVSPISHFISQSTQKQVIIDGNPFQNRKPLGIGTVDLPVASRRTDCASLISVAPQHCALTGRRSQ